MDLLKYLEPMKHLPDRFSNLAFWRGCRKFKDSVVNAFEYVDSWGESIESDIDLLRSKNITTNYVRFGDYSQNSTDADHWFTLNLTTGSLAGVAVSVHRNSANLPTLVSYNNLLPFAIMSIPCAIYDAPHVTGCTVNMLVHLEVHDGELYNIDSLCPNMDISIPNADISKVVYTIPGYASATPATLTYFTVT